MFRSTARFPLIFACLAISFPVRAAILEVTGVDYGTPGNSYTNPIFPGQSGDLFLTLRNPTSEDLQDVAMNFYNGACFSSDGGGALNIPHIHSGATVRVPTPLRVSVDSTCQRGDSGSFLLLGNFLDASQNRQRVWAEANLRVAPFPNIDFYQENINLYLPDLRVTDFTFTINDNITISNLGVFVEFDHSYPNDLDIYLIHPSGSIVRIASRSAQRSFRLGLNGTPFAPLQQFHGMNSFGVWTVRFDDRAGGDTGNLRKVGLYLRSN